MLNLNKITFLKSKLSKRKTKFWNLKIRPCKNLMKIYMPKSMNLRKSNFLQNKFDDSVKFLLKLTKGQENLNKLLGSQCVSFNKRVSDLNQTIRKDLIKTSWSKRHHKRKPIIDLVSETPTLVIIIEVSLFVIRAITTLVRGI